MDAESKLINARCRLMIREPFYGHMAMGMQWKESTMSWLKEPQRRIGIKITTSGIKAYFYPKWVDSMSLEQLFGAVQHIMNHLVRMHPIRQSGRRQDLWQRACDIQANGRKNTPRIGYREEPKMILPYQDLLWIPDDWPEDETTEQYYDRLLKDPDGVPSTCKYEPIDDHEIWLQSDASADEARQMIQERARDASEKSQGNVPGHLKEALEALSSPIVKWRELLRQFLSNHIGGKRSTYSRANRRAANTFGIKGVSHRAASEAVVIVDTSGSVSAEEMQQFFAEIEAIAYKCKLWVLLWDAAFNGVSLYRRGDWKNFPIHGGGGTDMAAPVTYLEENNMIMDVVIMLTDGETNWPPPRKFPMIFCVTGGTTTLPDWGQKVRIRV